LYHNNLCSCNPRNSYHWSDSQQEKCKPPLSDECNYESPQEDCTPLDEEGQLISYSIVNAPYIPAMVKKQQLSCKTRKSLCLEVGLQNKLANLPCQFAGKLSTGVGIKPPYVLSQNSLKNEQSDLVYLMLTDSLKE